MNFKKFVSTISAVAIAASAFAGLAVTASAEDAPTFTLASTGSIMTGTRNALDITFAKNAEAENSGAISNNDWLGITFANFTSTEAINASKLTKATLDVYVTASKYINGGHVYALQDTDYTGYTDFVTGSIADNSAVITENNKETYTTYTVHTDATKTAAHGTIGNSANIGANKNSVNGIVGNALGAEMTSSGGINNQKYSVDVTSYLKNLDNATSVSFAIGGFNRQVTVGGFGSESYKPVLTLEYADTLTATFNTVPYAKVVANNETYYANEAGVATVSNIELGSTFSYIVSKDNYSTVSDSIVMGSDKSIPVSLTLNTGCLYSETFDVADTAQDSLAWSLGGAAYKSGGAYYTPTAAYVKGNALVVYNNESGERPARKTISVNRTKDVETISFNIKGTAKDRDIDFVIANDTAAANKNRSGDVLFAISINNDNKEASAYVGGTFDASTSSGISYTNTTTVTTVDSAFDKDMAVKVEADYVHKIISVKIDDAKAVKVPMPEGYTSTINSLLFSAGRGGQTITLDNFVIRENDSPAKADVKFEAQSTTDTANDNEASLFKVIVTAGTDDITKLAIEADGVKSQNTESVNIASGSTVTFAAILNKIATVVKAVVNDITID